jgi:hypothetical protein
MDAFTFLPLSASAFDWPFDVLTVLHGFGDEVEGALLPGVIVEGLQGDPVNTHEGEVIFTNDSRTSLHQKLPTGLGNFVAFAHPEGLRSIIAQLDVEEILPEGTWAQGQRLGQQNYPTSDAEGVQPVLRDLPRPQVAVFYLDQNEDLVLNPMNVIPRSPQDVPPVIQQFRVKLENSEVWLPVRNLIRIPVTDADVQVVAFDQNPDRSPRNVFSIQAFLNGSEIFTYVLDKLDVEEGEWVDAQFRIPLDQVLSQGFTWDLGEVFFNQGAYTLVVEVTDTQGNVVRREIRLIAQR